MNGPRGGTPPHTTTTHHQHHTPHTTHHHIFSAYIPTAAHTPTHTNHHVLFFSLPVGVRPGTGPERPRDGSPVSARAPPRLGPLSSSSFPPRGAMGAPIFSTLAPHSCLSNARDNKQLYFLVTEHNTRRQNATTNPPAACVIHSTRGPPRPPTHSTPNPAC